MGCRLAGAWAGAGLQQLLLFSSFTPFSFLFIIYKL
jgi:hypothetical protein